MKRGQEEIVGFALIIILVMVIALVLIGFALRGGGNETSVESYEVDSFVQAMKQYTTDCAVDSSSYFRNIGQLASDCQDGKRCVDSRQACEVLEEDLKGIMSSSWDFNERGGLKGYSLILRDDGKVLVNITEGNSTRNYKAPSRRIDETLQIDLRIYEN